MPDTDTRSLLLVFPDQKAVWVRLPREAESPLVLDDLTGRPGSRLRIEGDSLEPVIRTYGMEGAAILTIRSLVERLAADQPPLAEAAPVLDAVVVLAGKVFAHRAGEMADDPLLAGDLRQLLYWFTDEGFHIGTAVDQGFFVTAKDHDLLKVALYCAMGREGPVVGLWPMRPESVMPGVASTRTLH
jgi:hypothetical protein